MRRSIRTACLPENSMDYSPRIAPRFRGPAFLAVGGRQDCASASLVGRPRARPRRDRGGRRHSPGHDRFGGHGGGRSPRGGLGRLRRSPARLRRISAVCVRQCGTRPENRTENRLGSIAVGSRAPTARSDAGPPQTRVRKLLKWRSRQRKCVSHLGLPTETQPRARRRLRAVSACGVALRRRCRAGVCSSCREAARPYRAAPATC
jgi:hypothetical protein